MQAKQYSQDEYVTGIFNNNRMLLARAITLIESNSEEHLLQAQQLLQRILPKTGKSIRIGITGIPGAGKSTFIDSFGTLLCKKGYKVAVLSIDPTSNITGGSILGDKTRMQELGNEPNSFIRPSPSGGTLGGVHRKTRETMLLCEAAGFDVILVETVGVGQNEITVRSMVDFFLLLMVTGTGDELQNVKRGIIENADTIVVNKADGNNVLAAQQFAHELNQALHYLTPLNPDWERKAFTISSIYQEGLEEIWRCIQKFQNKMQANGSFQEKRKKQNLDWLEALILDQLKMNFFHHPTIQNLLPTIQQQIITDQIPVTTGAKKLLDSFVNSN